MKKNVSLLIVSYNVCQFIAHAIDSILKSDLDNFEIIIIDNNSYDNTVSYLKERYNHLRQIKIIQNKENVGFGKAVNQAANIANGDFYLILNCCYHLISKYTTLLNLVLILFFFLYN